MTVKKFQALIYAFYEKEGRHTLPWRPPMLLVRKDGSINPYKVLVSEVMLQQTQVARVLPKYAAWMKKFPNIHALARASLKDVLLLWQGLGYSRRAKSLHELSTYSIKEYNGEIPRDEKELTALPGIGSYAANALRAFAFNLPAVLLETNIRTAIIHHYFKNNEKVSDTDIKKVLENVADKNNSRIWYYALMDYGASLKTQGISHNVKSKHYAKQTKFKGSPRQVRGEILKVLAYGAMSEKRLVEKLSVRSVELVREKIRELLKEKLISKKNRKLDLG